jgi:hypothetical protein
MLATAMTLAWIRNAIRIQGDWVASLRPIGWAGLDSELMVQHEDWEAQAPGGEGCVQVVRRSVLSRN